MPRLVGRTSKMPLYAIASCLLITVVITTSEHASEIDLVPDFGRENPEMKIPDFHNYKSIAISPSIINLHIA
jgi:hypothetical protein